MGYNSKNMNYIFYVEYFEKLDKKDLLNENNEKNEKIIKRNNEAIRAFKFHSKSMKKEYEEMGLKIHTFSLFTIYPGLLAGIGNMHKLPIKGELQCGFNFDYVTGVPYIPGSSLKGLLRSYFSETELAKYVLAILHKDENIDLKKLVFSIFDDSEVNKSGINNKQDVFLGAYPSNVNNQEMMEMEYITPHKKAFKNPKPITMLKVKGGVEFDFCFILNDYCDDAGKVIVSADEKLELFKRIILNMGAGAKTNTGFGQFSEEKPKPHYNSNDSIFCEEDRKKTQNSQGKCAICGRETKLNNRTNRYYKYCYKCSQKLKNEKKI